MFVIKINPDGQVAYMTFLSSGEPYGIAVDSNGEAYITGNAYSNYPTTPGAFDTSFNGVGDVFVTKIDPSGQNLAYSTLVGGSYWDIPFNIAIDETGAAYVPMVR